MMRENSTNKHQHNIATNWHMLWIVDGVSVGFIGVYNEVVEGIMLHYQMLIVALYYWQMGMLWLWRQNSTLTMNRTIKCREG